MSASSQSRLCFIDTNIWLYAFIPSQDPNKSVRAKAIIHAEILYSEDLDRGLDVENRLKVVNPFVR